MNENQLKFLWDNYANNKGFSGYDEFKSLMANDNSRKVFFENSNKELGFKDYNEFEGVLGVKKKEGTQAASGQPVQQPGRPSAPSFGQKITEKIAGSATQIPLKTTLQKEQEESKMAGEIVSGFVKGVKQKEEERKQAYEQGGVAYEEFKQKQAAETSRIAKAKEEESKNKKASEFKGYVREKDVFQMPTPGESQDYSYDFTKTYIDYLSQSDPDRADFVRDKYFTLKAKGKTERDSEDEKFLRQIESEALDMTYRAKSQELDLTIAAIDKLQKKATPADKGALDYLYKKYESTKNSLKGITAAYDQNKLQYGKIAGSELQAEEEKLARFKELQEGGAVPVATEFFKGIGNAVTNGVINLYQIPKVMGDLVGDTDYDWADQMYDSVSGAKRELDKDFGTPLPQGMKMSDLPTTARLAVVGGNAIGSVGLFAAGGAIGGTTRLGQAAATFGTSFLTTESDYYQEALDAGMSAQDAAFSATYLAAQTALVESIIPDVRYFQPSAFRKSVIQGLSSGVRAGLPIKEAAKMAFKNTIQAIPQSAGSLAKAGTKEAGEEILGQAAEDIGKEVINASAQREYFNDTFDPEAYTDAILGGFIAGGGLSVFSRPNSKSPTQQEVMREIVDRRDLLTRPGTASDKIAGKEDLRDFNDATEIFDAMSSHSAWKDMPREKQNQAFALAQQTAIMKKEQERMKKLRIPDEQKDAEIKRLEDEVNMMFAEQLEQQKQAIYDQENIQGIPGQVGVGQELVQGQPIQGAGQEATTAGGVLQAPGQEEVTPTTEVATISNAERRDEEIRKRGLDRLFPITIDETTPEGKKLAKEKAEQEDKIKQLDAELAASEAQRTTEAVSEKKTEYKKPKSVSVYLSTPNNDGSFNKSSERTSFVDGASMYVFEAIGNNRFNVYISENTNASKMALQFPEKNINPIFPNIQEDFSTDEVTNGKSLDVITPAVVELQGNKYVLVSTGKIDLDGKLKKQPTTEAAPEVKTEGKPTAPVTEETKPTKPTRKERISKLFEEEEQVAPEAEETTVSVEEEKPTKKTGKGGVQKAPTEGKKPSKKAPEIAPAPRRAGSVEATEGDNPIAGTENTLAAAGMNETSLSEWKKANEKDSKKGRIEELAELVRNLMSGKIKFKDYYERAKQIMPSKLMDKVPAITSFKEIVGSIDRNKLEKGVINLNKFIKKGTRVGLRIDIPAFNRFGKNVVTVHEGKGSRSPIGYGSTGSIQNVTFRTSVSTAAKIGTGEDKSAFAMAVGEWMDELPESIQARAQEALNSPEWIQVGMNPIRSSFFFDKADGNPVVSADEVLQVGNLVLAKNAKKIDLNTKEGMTEFEKMFSAKTKEGVTYQYRRTGQGFRQRLSAMFDTEGERAAEDLAKFYEGTGIDVEIIDDVEAQRLGQERNIEGNLEGLFIADKDSGKIYLNRDALKRVGKTLVYHEGIHPVINIIRNTNPELYKKVLDGIRLEAKRNPAIARAIRQIESVKEYQKRGSEAIEDETIVEVLARIAAGDIDLSKVNKTLKDDLIDFWNKIAKALRLPTINPNASTQEFRDFAKKLSTALTEGGKLADVVGAENITEFAPPPSLSVIDEEAQELIVPGSQITGTPNIGQASIANSQIEGFDTKPSKVTGVKMKYPKPRTMEDVLSDSGGAAVFVNSDGTKVGVVNINGKKYEVQGGLDYTFIEKNVNDNVGFAASENQKISTLNSIAKGIAELRDKKDPKHKGKPIAVFVVSQNGEAMLGEWYAGEYIMEGIDKALTEGTYEGGIDAAREQFSNAIKDVVITTKTEDGKKDNKARNTLIEMIESNLFDTHKGRMKIADFLSSKEVSFGLRSKINGEIIAANPKLSGRGKNQQLKKALADAGHHMENFWKLFADERFLPAIEKERLVPEKGKVFANKTFSGFYYDPFVSIEEQIEHTKKGVKHRQFNSKFKSVGNHFLLTEAHDVNKLFPDMGYADNAGYEIYNKANNTDLGKKSSIGDRIKVSEWLNKNGYNKNVINPYSSISLSIYTGYVTEEYKAPGAKIPSAKIKGQPSVSIDRSSIEETAKALKGVDLESLFEKTKSKKYFRGQPVEELPKKDIFISPNEIVGKMYTKGAGVLKKLSLKTSNLFDIDTIVTKDFNDKLIDAWRKSSRDKTLVIPKDVLNGNYVGLTYAQSLKEDEQFRRALEEMGYDGLLNNFTRLKLPSQRQEVIVFDQSNVSEINADLISELYHKAKQDSSNPELVKAVEDLIGKPKRGQASVSIDRSKAPVTIEPIDFENESENIDVYEASERASKIAKDNGVNILRGKDLKSVALDDEGNVVGGLWTEISGDEFSFDIAVDKSMQGKGVGERLVKEAISEFNAENFENQLKYKVDVTNPVMEKLLSKYGFEVTERIDGHTMMEHPTNNPKLKRGQPSVSIDRSKEGDLQPLPEGISIVNGWYSPIEKRLRETKADKQSAQKWLTSGIIGKGDEAIYTGVKGWLESKRPNEQVSKQEILDWMDNNRVEIQEVSKSDEPKMSDTEARNVFENQGYDVVTDSNGDTYVEKDDELYEYDDMSPLEQDAFDVLTRGNLDTGRQMQTKYQTYQLEGEKRNYKELLVTLPTERQKATVVEIDGKWRIKHTDGSLSFAKYSSKEFAEKDLKEYIENEQTGERTDITTFRSLHFDEPNILVHLRMNTRTDADGKKVLFLEELQSDWGQKGKREGFAGNVKELPSNYRIEKIRTYDSILGDYRFEVVDDQGYMRASGDTEAEAKENALEYLNKKGTPAAPFVTDTNAWTKLGLKMALREAVKQGADKVAWTTGEQQNERYDLSKSVDSVEYREDTSTLYAYKDGNEVLNQVVENENEIANYVGKDVAERLLASTPDNMGSRMLEGEQLKIGGKGMKGFYDNIVPNVAQALVKELTGQRIDVGKTKLKTSETREQEKLGFAFVDGKFSAVDNKGEVVFSSESRKEVLDYIKGENLTTQQSIDITPELKASVSRGIAQFSANIPRTPSDVRQAMEDSGDAVEQAIASGTDPQTAVDDLIGSQDWYNELSPRQKEQFDEILQDEFGVTPKAKTGIRATIAEIINNYYKGDRQSKLDNKRILESDPKLKYIYDNISKINKQLQDAGVITDKTDGCP